MVTRVGVRPMPASDWSLAHIRPSDWLVVTLEVADEETPADTALLTIMVIILWAVRPRHERTQGPRQGPAPRSSHRLAPTLQQTKHSDETITTVKYSCQHTLWFWWNVQSLDMRLTESRNLARQKTSRNNQQLSRKMFSRWTLIINILLCAKIN